MNLISLKYQDARKRKEIRKKANRILEEIKARLNIYEYLTLKEALK